MQDAAWIMLPACCAGLVKLMCTQKHGRMAKMSLHQSTMSEDAYHRLAARAYWRAMHMLRRYDDCGEYSDVGDLTTTS
ncbi:hypothetical protein MGYG_00586 [Nannizzia gypsea CBS 118893]|uniref:Uncharacterized protein n=1 Tax=Arthroderma gypseum (strain ATCC MYA-4604 / CBS 118893) TaxID=535722 RepID=E5R0I6_ARTGP|nr:hypothetical protein MGYG_00586 [Nannizzia gypsea CBS 118893]EFQ97545.1 hypothetical protein MGYG_00586 [Nannizzia gypsea CBS 118893]